MTVTVYQFTQGPTGPRWCEAFARGAGARIVRDGHPATLPMVAGAAALWGDPQAWPIWQRARANGQPWFYGDHGYFGRFKFFRCTANAFQHSGRGAGDPARFKQFGIKIEPWRKNGQHILVCPNSAEYFALHKMNVQTWLRNVRAELARVTDRPVIVRWKETTRPLAEDLANAWCTVVFTSQCGVDGLLAGVPCIATGPTPAATLGTSNLGDVERVPTPDGREHVAAVLAANQWTLDEYADGTAWRALQQQAREVAA